MNENTQHEIDVLLRLSESIKKTREFLKEQDFDSALLEARKIYEELQPYGDWADVAAVMGRFIINKDMREIEQLLNYIEENTIAGLKNLRSKAA